MDYSIFERHSDYCVMYSKETADIMIENFIKETMEIDELVILLEDIYNFPYTEENILKYMKIFDFLNYKSIDMFVGVLYIKYFKQGMLLDILYKYPVVTHFINEIMKSHKEFLTYEEMKYITDYIDLETVILNDTISLKEFNSCRFGNIEYFVVNSYITDEVIERFDIKTLYMEYNNIITDKSLSKQINMVYLDLGYNINITDLSIIPMKKLECLFIDNNTNLTNISVYDKISLKELYLGFNKNINDDGICNLTNLEYLFIDYNTQITDKGICNLRKVKSLVIGESTNFTDEGIYNMTSLEKLTVGNSYRITDASIERLVNLKDINIMSGVNIGKSLQYLPKLANINIGDTQLVTDAVLLKIAGNITQLFAGDTLGVPISDKSVKKMKNLQRLHMRANHNINNKTLRKLHNLRFLALGWNDNITNKGLKNLKKLEHLCLDKNKKITENGIAHLTSLKFLMLGDNKKVKKTKHGYIMDDVSEVYAPGENVDTI